MAPGHRAEVGTGIPGVSEPPNRVECSGKGCRGLDTDTRDAHQDLASLRLTGDRAQFAIQFPDLFDQMPARRDHAAHAMGGRRFDMDLLVEAGSCQIGGIVRICLVRLHCLEALMGLQRIDAHDIAPQLPQSQADGRGHTAGLDDSPRDGPHLMQCPGNRFGCAFAPWSVRDCGRSRQQRKPVYFPSTGPVRNSSSWLLLLLIFATRRVRHLADWGKQPQITR